MFGGGPQPDVESVANHNRRAHEVIVDVSWDTLKDIHANDAAILSTFAPDRQAIALPQQVARLRLEAVDDAIAAAEDDLRLAVHLGQSGSGPLAFDDILARQAGLPELRVGNVLHHGILLEQARQAAFALLAADPDLQQPEHQALALATQTRWGKRFELATIG